MSDVETQKQDTKPGPEKGPGPWEREYLTETTSESKPSTGTPLLNAALAAAQGEFPIIEKRRQGTVQMSKGGSHSYKYADISDVLAAIRPVLSKHGLALIQSVENDEKELATYLLHSSGQEKRNSIPFASAGGNGPQAVGSSLTYARRYGVCAMVGVASEEDDDGRAGNTDGGKKTDDKTKNTSMPDSGPKKAQTHTAADWKDKPISDAQRKLVFKLWGEAGYDEDALKPTLKKHYKKDSIKDLTGGEASRIIETLKNQIADRDAAMEAGAP